VLFRTSPLFVERVWGSMELEGRRGPIGEVWWVHDGEEGSSKLTDPHGGTTGVADLMAAGMMPGSGVFPVLLKTLHTADRLSVQVHPGIGGGSLYKEETWLVLDAEPGAWMMGGTDTTDRDEFARAAMDGEADRLLSRIPLRENDVYHLPPGTIHSLGPGLHILEVQSNCDVTYRLYDWGRVDAAGLSRDLHLEKGLGSVDWSAPGRPVRVRSGADGRLDLEARYSITAATGRRRVPVPPGGIFFLRSGSLLLGSSLDAPACLIADSEGGSFSLDGSGYLIETEGI